MKATKLIKHISILVIILVIPGFLYYLLQAKGKNRYKPLRYFGARKLSGTFHSVRGKKIADTVYYKVDPVPLTDLNGKQVADPLAGSKITVIQFFYTHDTLLVPRMTAAMARLSQAYDKNDLIRFISITVDPERDSLPVLKAYAARYINGNTNWQFYTGRQDSILKLAQEKMMVNAARLPADGKFIFSDKVILLDPLSHVRGFYQVAQPADEKRLNDELKVQVAEELRKIKGAH